MVESSVKSLSKPVFEKLEPKLGQLDDFACRQLDKVTHSFRCHMSYAFVSEICTAFIYRYLYFAFWTIYSPIGSPDGRLFLLTHMLLFTSFFPPSYPSPAYLHMQCYEPSPFSFPVRKGLS